MRDTPFALVCCCDIGEWCLSCVYWEAGGGIVLPHICGARGDPARPGCAAVQRVQAPP